MMMMKMSIKVLKYAQNYTINISNKQKKRAEPKKMRMRNLLHDAS